jgi:hypothetical protein
MSVIYDRYAELYEQGMGWGSGVGYNGYTGNKSEGEKNNAISLESMSYTPGLLLGRYQYPKLIARGNSVTNYANVYLVYFDANTPNKEIIMRNFRIGKEGTGKYQLFSGGIASDGKSYAEYSNLPDYATGRITAASGASNHYGFGVTSDNRVVIVYYDESAGKLKLVYSSTAVICDSPSTTRKFTVSSINFPDYVGNYVSMTIDGNNRIHIAALDASDSDLVYFQIDKYNSTTYTMARVDQASAVGNWTQIKIRDGIPYIAYYNATEAGGRDAIKLAYAKSSTVNAGVDSNGYTTGNWEYMTVPAITPPQGGTKEFQNVCLDFDSAGLPVVGYLGANIEFGKWLTE